VRLCAQLLARDSGAKESALKRRAALWFDRVIDGYARGLRWVLAHRFFMLMFIFVTFGITVLLYVWIPKGFFPQQDNGLIAGVTEASSDISYAAMAERMRTMADLVRQDEDIQNVYYWIEGDPSINVGRMLIDLKPFGVRKASVYRVIDRVKERVKGVPEIALRMQARQDLQVGARVSKTQFQYTLRDANLEPPLLPSLPTVVAKLLGSRGERIGN